MSTVSVIVPSIPVRQERLARALSSVANQNRRADEILVRVANDRLAAPFQRDAMLAKVTTEWVAPLDDDDELYPMHLDVLLQVARSGEADIIYPWFDVIGGTDPFPQFEGLEWDNDHPHQVPITALFRTSLLRDLGGWGEGWDVTDPDCPGLDRDGNRAGEDYALILRAVKAGATIVHLPVRSWAWHHWALPGGGVGNSMGLPSKVAWE